MKHVKLPPVPTATRKLIGLVALLLLAVATWIVCILLLIEVTRQLLDVLRYIVDLAQMG